MYGYAKSVTSLQIIIIYCEINGKDLVAPLSPVQMS